MQLMAHLNKELKLLTRDYISLLTLFLMPAFFLLAITLVQSNTLKHQGPPLTLYLLNHDHSGETIIKALHKVTGNSNIKLVTLNTKQAHHFSALLSQANHILLTIAPNAEKTLQAALKKRAIGQTATLKPALLTISTSAAAPPGFSNQLKQLLQQALLQQRLNATQTVLSQTLGTQPPKPLRTDIITVNQKFSPQKVTDNNNIILQNVSAWTVFGLFFVIIPAAGTLLNERRYGVLQRLTIAPAAFSQFLAGKILAYLLLHWVQLIFILLLAHFILPLFGLPALMLTSNSLLTSFFAVMVISLMISATGFLIASLLRSFEQVSSISSLLIIVGAAIGGVMMPTYLMPQGLQTVSAYSPLHWAQQLLLKTLSFAQIDWWWLVVSLLFAVGCFMSSLLINRIKNNTR